MWCLMKCFATFFSKHDIEVKLITLVKVGKWCISRYYCQLFMRSLIFDTWLKWQHLLKQTCSFSLASQICWLQELTFHGFFKWIITSVEFLMWCLINIKSASNTRLFALYNRVQKFWPHLVTMIWKLASEWPIHWKKQFIGSWKSVAKR